MKNVGVVGCGLMGAGIAEVCARAGLDVVVVESSPAAAEAGHARLEQSLDRAAKKGKIANAAEVLARISVVTERRSWRTVSWWLRRSSRTRPVRSSYSPS